MKPSQRRSSKARWAVVCGLLSATIAWGQAPGAAGTPQTPSAGAAAEVPAAIQWAERRADAFLDVPADWPLSAEVRAAAQDLLLEASPRLRAVLREWVVELQADLLSNPALGASQRDMALALALDNRLRNEQALHGLDTAGDAHMAWRESVDTQAGWCRTFWAAAKWGEVLLQIERLPQALRAAALRHEAEVLARWGKARPALLARPAFSLDAYAAGLLTRVRDGRPDQRPPVAMVPVVAAVLLRDKAAPLAGSDTTDPPGRNVRCAALQWALANARVEGVATPAELSAAFRHALIFRAEDLERPKDSPDDRAKALLELGYPLNMAWRELTGSVQVRVVRDDAGRTIEARVVARKLTASGLEGRRPVFFETALDAASIAKARALPVGPPGARTIDFVWKLE